jgi:hypothetical protein
MPFYPDNLKDWISVGNDVFTTLFVVFGGGWALYQYVLGTRLKAAETLLKVEEEFRNVFQTYEAIEDSASYQKLIKPVLDAERKNTLDDKGLEKLGQIDRCLRFLYLCSVLNDTLRVDRIFGVKVGVLRSAYYYYIAILLSDERKQRPELLDYTDLYYPRLTEWVHKNEAELRNFRKHLRTSEHVHQNESTR